MRNKEKAGGGRYKRRPCRRAADADRLLSARAAGASDRDNDVRNNDGAVVFYACWRRDAADRGAFAVVSGADGPLCHALLLPRKQRAGALYAVLRGQETP